ncbi:hypothetical protein [Galbibacter sp. BG1]
MDEFNIQISIPIVRTFREDKYPQEIIKKALDNLIEATKQIRVSNNFFDNLKISMRRYSSMPKKFLKTPKAIFHLSDETVLVFSCKALIDYNAVAERVRSEEGFEEKYFGSVMDFGKDLVKFETIKLFKKSLDEVFILSHISTPGALKFRDGVLFIDNKFYEEYETLSGFVREAFEHCDSIKYPRIKHVSTQKLLTQIKSMDVGFKLTPTCQLEKALNCLSNVLNPRLDINEILMYSVIGLETLFVSGEQNIQKQIDENVQLLLGRLSSHKRIIKNLYNFRSKLFHGEFELKPYHYYRNELVDYIDDTDSKLYEACAFSTLILIATIQEMILTGRKELIYKTELTN